FARKVYVDPLASSWVPEPLLWTAGVTNPIIQISMGVLLILGLRTRFAASVVGAFLVTIFFGHLLADPFDRGDSPHAYAMANFLIAIVVLWLQPRGDRFSVDAMLARRGRGRTAALAAALLVLAGCAWLTWTDVDPRSTLRDSAAQSSPSRNRRVTSPRTMIGVLPYNQFT
ncbi:MAG TPA: DoxX family protein, partial [Thermoanaerobaculia bacterium]|nr:DoxX family protein [Thermoanaerobaculia bacterium]